MTQFQGSSKVENMISNILDGGYLTTNRYVAEFELPAALIDEQSNMPNIMIRCMNVTIPGRNVSNVGYRIYGPARQMPYEILYAGEITLTYMLSRDMRERAFFEKWMSKVINNQDYKVGYYDDYIGNLTIHVLDKSDQESQYTVVQEVYPKTIGDLTFANDRENEYLTQEVVLAFRKYTSHYITPQFPENPGGDPSQQAFPSTAKKNNGNGLGIGAFFNGVREGANNVFNGVGNFLSGKKT